MRITSDHLETAISILNKEKDAIMDKGIIFGVFDKFTKKCYFTGTIEPAELIKTENELHNIERWIKETLNKSIQFKSAEAWAGIFDKDD